jgi:hypothetical protein
MLKLGSSIAVLGALLLLGSGTTSAADPETQKQLDDLKAAIPKFAIPMREVGDRFQDMNSAVRGGNWVLAAYMSKYMNNAMNPARLTRPRMRRRARPRTRPYQGLQRLSRGDGLWVHKGRQAESSF